MHYILSALLYKRQFVSLRWRINFLWQCVPRELSKFIWRHWKNSVSYFPILEEIYQYVLLLCWFSSAKSTKWVRALCIHFPNISRLYRDVDTHVSDTSIFSPNGLPDIEHYGQYWCQGAGCCSHSSFVQSLAPKSLKWVGDKLWQVGMLAGNSPEGEPQFATSKRRIRPRWHGNCFKNNYINVETKQID